MRPRTKSQLRVVGLSKALPGLTDTQEKWAFKTCLQHLAFRTKRQTNCMDCGHIWDTADSSLLIVKLMDTQVICPACGTSLHVEDTRRKKHFQRAFLGKVDVVEEFQLFRFFKISAHYRAGKNPYINIWEVAQIWHNPSGKSEVIGMNTSGYNGNFCGDMEIRDRRRIDREYSVWPKAILPGAKVLPIYKRNGFKGKFHGVGPYDLLRTLLIDTKAETLLKAGQFELLRGRVGDKYHDVSQYWDTIKICMRNNYIVKEGITYLDYLKLLSYFKKDLHSPKYVCPSNLKREHNKLVAKKQAIDLHNSDKRDYSGLTRYLELDADISILSKPVPLHLEVTRLRALRDEKVAHLTEERRIAHELEKAKEEQAKKERFERSYARFAGMVFKKADITVVVLQTIDEFKAEGEALKHCVFTNGYYKKENSLVLSARIDGKPIETIEVVLDKMQILQARGLNNESTKYHKLIIDLVTDNLHQIRKRLKPRKTRKMNEELLQTA